MLSVDAPTLAYPAVTAGTAALENPVEVHVVQVRRDGAPVGPESLAAYGYLVHRRAAAGAAAEVWDAAAQTWVADPGAVDPATIDPLAYQPDQPIAWRGIIVGAGGQDAGGQPQYATATGGYPSYSVRAFFATGDGAESALSPSTDSFTFASATDRHLLVLGPGPDERPEDATEARIVLRDAALQDIGWLRIIRATPGAEITVANAAGASVVLHPDGHLELIPAAGRAVHVRGDLETELITYRPAGGGPKRQLA